MGLDDASRTDADAWFYSRGSGDTRRSVYERGPQRRQHLNARSHRLIEQVSTGCQRANTQTPLLWRQGELGRQRGVAQLLEMRRAGGRSGLPGLGEACECSDACLQVAQVPNFGLGCEHSLRVVIVKPYYWPMRRMRGFDEREGMAAPSKEE